MFCRGCFWKGILIFLGWRCVFHSSILSSTSWHSRMVRMIDRSCCDQFYECDFGWCNIVLEFSLECHSLFKNSFFHDLLSTFWSHENNCCDADIQFWNKNKSMEGLSARSVVINFACQLIVFLYLLDNETSWMIILSAGMGCCIEFWKIGKAMHIEVPTAWIPYRYFYAVGTVRSLSMLKQQKISI